MRYLLLICGDESAAGLDEAIEAAARHPAAGYGTIEIRPFSA